MSKIKNKKTAGSLGRGLESLLGANDFVNNEFANKEFANKELNNSAENKDSNNSAENKISTTPNEKNILFASLEWIKPNKNQPRLIFDNQALTELAQSIKAQGILQPIVVRPCGEREFEIIAGERRWRAAQKAGLKKIPVIIKSANDQLSAELALIENIQREDLNPMEEAEALHNLLSNGKMTQQVLADRLGKNRSSLANLLRLLNLNPEVRGFLKNNQLSLGHAKLLLSLENLNTQKHFAQLSIKKNLSVQALARLIKKNQLLNKAQSFKNIERTEKQIQLNKVAEQIQKKLGTKVQLEYSNGQGCLSIHFSTDAQLNQIVQSLTGLK